MKKKRRGEEEGKSQSLLFSAAWYTSGVESTRKSMPWVGGEVEV